MHNNRIIIWCQDVILSNFHTSLWKGTAQIEGDKGHHGVISKAKGWHCFNCGEVEFEAGEGVRFAEAIKQVAKKIDAREAAELARIRKKLKLTQQEAALLTGGGQNAFSRYERGKAKPLQSVTNLFKLLDNHPDLLDEIAPGSEHP